MVEQATQNSDVNDMSSPRVQKPKTRKALKAIAKKQPNAKPKSKTKRLMTPVAKPAMQIVNQPDDPGKDEQFDWVQIKTSWGTTPVWVKSLLVVLALIAVAGFLF